MWLVWQRILKKVINSEVQIWSCLAGLKTLHMFCFCKTANNSTWSTQTAWGTHQDQWQSDMNVSACQFFHMERLMRKITGGHKMKNCQILIFEINAECKLMVQEQQLTAVEICGWLCGFNMEEWLNIAVIIRSTVTAKMSICPQRTHQDICLFISDIRTKTQKQMRGKWTPSMLAYYIFKIFTEVCICLNSKCTFQWIAQQPMMTEKNFQFLKKHCL